MQVEQTKRSLDRRSGEKRITRGTSNTNVNTNTNVNKNNIDVNVNVDDNDGKHPGKHPSHPSKKGCQKTLGLVTATNQPGTPCGVEFA